MNCPNCGLLLHTGAEFCHNCGHPVSQPSHIASQTSRMLAAFLDILVIILVFFIPLVMVAIVGLAAGHGGREVNDNILWGLLAPIPYLLWWIIAMGRGQSPMKQLFRIKVVRRDGRRPGWWRMLVRDVAFKWGVLVAGAVLSVLSIVSFPIVTVPFVLESLWALLDKDGQSLHDKLLDTVVVRTSPPAHSVRAS